MTHPTLFDHLPGPAMPPSVSEPATPAPTAARPSTTQVDPATPAHRPTVAGSAPAPPPTRPSSSPIDHLRRTLEREHRTTVGYDWHPREDKLWIARDRATYELSVRRGKAQYRFTPDALRQFAALLNVPMALLERLAGFPRVEDCRLLNMLLWAEGARPETRFQFQIKGNEIVAARSGTFVTLDPLALAQRLADAEAEGRFRVRRYDRGPQHLWVEFEHGAVAPIDVSPTIDRAGNKADLWRIGAILVNQEDGSRAVTVFPALIREWGGLVLPVLSSRADLRKRRHAHVAPDALLQAALGDLAATREAPYAEAARRLRGLHQQFLPNSGVHAYLEGLALPFPSTAHRDAVVRQVIAGRATLYRLVTAVLKEAKTIDDSGRRLKLAFAIGRLVWNRAPHRAKGTAIRAPRGNSERPPSSPASPSSLADSADDRS